MRWLDVKADPMPDWWPEPPERLIIIERFIFERRCSVVDVISGLIAWAVAIVIGLAAAGLVIGAAG